MQTTKRHIDIQSFDGVKSNSFWCHVCVVTRCQTEIIKLVYSAAAAAAVTFSGSSQTRDHHVPPISSLATLLLAIPVTV